MMDEMYHRWKNTTLRLANQFEDEHPDVTSRTFIEEIHAWEDFACQEVGI